MLGSMDIIVFVAITDAEKARTFYEGVLGLRFIKDDGFALVFEANGTMVRAAKMKKSLRQHNTRYLDGKCPTLRMWCARSETVAWIRDLRLFKQDELGIWTAPTGDKVAWFKDPDGNVLSVSQHVS